MGEILELYILVAVKVEPGTRDHMKVIIETLKNKGQNTKTPVSSLSSCQEF